MWKDFFAETTSASMTRLLSFMLVCGALIIQVVVLYLAFTTHGQVINNVYIPADTSIMDLLNYSTGILLGFGLGAKVVQKFGEKNNIDITPKS